jgi:quinolinate synthase
VLEIADSIQSTSGMISFAGQSDHDSFIIGTETGLLYPLSKAYPAKKLYPASKKMYCTTMKTISLENLSSSLENMTGEIKVPEDIRKKALGAVQRMIDL